MAVEVLLTSLKLLLMLAGEREKVSSAFAPESGSLNTTAGMKDTTVLTGSASITVPVYISC